MSNRTLSGERIRFFRERAGLSQTELAERTGIRPNTISNWELGFTYPQYEGIRKLCKALSCSADELLGLTPPTLTAQEYRSLERYRLLDDDGRHTVDAIQDTQLRRLGLLDG